MHVDRILATPASRDWLTRVMKMYFTLNQLPGVIIDNTRPGFEIAGGALFADLEESAERFLTDVMWNGKVMDLITSREGVPQQQPRVDGLQGSGAGGRDAHELRRDDASGGSARRAC